MARRATPKPNPEARLLASRIQDARRRGATNREIGERFGMNERTVRKIVAGETPGTRIYAAKVPTPKVGGTTPNIMRANFDLGDGVIRSRNVKIPNLPGIHGPVAPTPFDAFRLPELQGVAEAEGRAMQRRYGMTEANAPRLVGLQRIIQRRAAKLITIKGVVRGAAV